MRPDSTYFCGLRCNRCAGLALACKRDPRVQARLKTSLAAGLRKRQSRIRLARYVNSGRAIRHVLGPPALVAVSRVLAPELQGRHSSPCRHGQQDLLAWLAIPRIFP